MGVCGRVGRGLWLLHTDTPDCSLFPMFQINTLYFHLHVFISPVCVYLWIKNVFLSFFGPNPWYYVNGSVCLTGQDLVIFVWLYSSTEGIPTTSTNVTVNLPQRQEALNAEEESSVRALYTAFMPQHLQVRNHMVD